MVVSFYPCLLVVCTAVQQPPKFFIHWHNKIGNCSQLSLCACILLSMLVRVLVQVLTHQDSIETRWHDVEDLISGNLTASVAGASGAATARNTSSSVLQRQQVTSSQPLNTVNSTPIVLGTVQPLSVTAAGAQSPALQTNYSLPPPGNTLDGPLIQNVTMGSAALTSGVNASELLAALGTRMTAFLGSPHVNWCILTVHAV